MVDKFQKKHVSISTDDIYTDILSIFDGCTAKEGKIVKKTCSLPDSRTVNAIVPTTDPESAMRKDSETQLDQRQKSTRTKISLRTDKGYQGHLAKLLSVCFPHLLPLCWHVEVNSCGRYVGFIKLFGLVFKNLNDCSNEEELKETLANMICEFIHGLILSASHPTHPFLKDQVLALMEEVKEVSSMQQEQQFSVGALDSSSSPISSNNVVIQLPLYFSSIFESHHQHNASESGHLQLDTAPLPPRPIRLVLNPILLLAFKKNEFLHSSNDSKSSIFDNLDVSAEKKGEFFCRDSARLARDKDVGTNGMRAVGSCAAAAALQTEQRLMIHPMAHGLKRPKIETMKNKKDAVQPFYLKNKRR